MMSDATTESMIGNNRTMPNIKQEIDNPTTPTQNYQVCSPTTTLQHQEVLFQAIPRLLVMNNSRPAIIAPILTVLHIFTIVRSPQGN